MGAMYSMPRDTKVRRTVPSETPAILDRKISRDSMTHAKNGESVVRSAIIAYALLRFLLRE